MTDSSNIHLYGIGHAMVDYYAILPKNEELPLPLEQGKATHLDGSDMTSLLETLKNITKNTTFVKTAGGTCANILRKCSSNGFTATFSGTVGSIDLRRDKDSVFFQEECAKAKLNAHLSIVEGNTGRCIAAYAHSSPLKAIAASPSVARSITKEQVLESEIEKSTCVVLEGMIFFNVDVITHILNLCKKHNKTIAIDVASTFCAPKAILELSNFLKDGTIDAKNILLFANEFEYDAIQNDSKDELSYLLENGAIISQKLGPQGAILHTKDSTIEETTEAVNALDDTGAGDAFAAGFLMYYLTHNKDEDNFLQNCLKSGNTVAKTVLDDFGLR